jgi:hypothetical protein
VQKLPPAIFHFFEKNGFWVWEFEKSFVGLCCASLGSWEWSF